MTIHLAQQDTDRLTAILCAQPYFRTEQGRIDFITAFLQGSPRKANLQGLMTYNGNSREWATRTIEQLVQFGQDRPGCESLCLLIHHLSTYIGEGDEQVFMRRLLDEYCRTKPVVAIHKSSVWRSVGVMAGILLFLVACIGLGLTIYNAVVYSPAAVMSPASSVAPLPVFTTTSDFASPHSSMPTSTLRATMVSTVPTSVACTDVEMPKCIDLDLVTQLGQRVCPDDSGEITLNASDLEGLELLQGRAVFNGTNRCKCEWYGRSREDENLHPISSEQDCGFSIAIPNAVTRVYLVLNNGGQTKLFKIKIE